MNDTALTEAFEDAGYTVEDKLDELETAESPSDQDLVDFEVAKMNDTYDNWKHMPFEAMAACRQLFWGPVNRVRSLKKNLATAQFYGAQMLRRFDGSEIADVKIQTQKVRIDELKTVIGLQLQIEASLRDAYNLLVDAANDVGGRFNHMVSPGTSDMKMTAAAEDLRKSLESDGVSTGVNPKNKHPDQTVFDGTAVAGNIAADHSE